MATKTAPKSLVEAVQLVFEALEPFDDGARQRILASAASLLGSALPASAPAAAASHGRSPTIQAAPAVADRPLSPVELIQQKSPATNAQRLALFAYYRERYEGLSRFSKEDLRGYFAKSKEPPPGNFDRDYQNAVKLGWIYDDKADSYLTSKGLEAVEGGFDGKTLPRGRHAGKATGGKKAKRKKKKS